MPNIGPIQLAHPFCQAGLAGYSDRAMRLVARRRGCPYAVTEALLGSGLPVTLLRITQFHDFVDELLGTARRGPVLPVPMGWRARPVDVGEAAAYTATIAAGAPSGDVVEYGGPEELTAAEMARAWAAAREPGARVVATPVPGRLSAAFRDGAALPTGGARGHRTYQEHLRG